MQACSVCTGYVVFGTPVLKEVLHDVTKLKTLLEVSELYQLLLIHSYSIKMNQVLHVQEFSNDMTTQLCCMVSYKM